MTTIFKWVVNQISSVSNSAAETLLQNIIKRFLEDPIPDDALSLQLFQDWTLKLQIKKVFLSVSLVNPYVPFLHFNSIYISSIKFDGSYNLSNLRAVLERIVIDIDAKAPENVGTPDANLTESISQLKEQLPIENKNKSFSDWIVDSVKNVNINLVHFTTIVRMCMEDENPLSIIAEKMELNYSHEGEISVKCLLSSLSLLIGLKRNQKKIVAINNVHFEMSKTLVSLSIESLSIKIDEKISETIASLIKIIPQGRKKPQRIQKESDFSMNITLSLKNLNIETSNGIILSVSELSIISNLDNIDISIKSINLLHNDIKILSFDNMKDSFHLSLTNPSKGKDLNSFTDFPEEISGIVQYMSCLKVKKSMNGRIELPSIIVEITEKFIYSMIEILKWGTYFQFQNESEIVTPNKSTSLVMSVILPSFSLLYRESKIMIRNIECILFSFNSNIQAISHIFSRISDIAIQLNIQNQIISSFHSMGSESNALSFLISSIKGLGKDDEMRLSVILSNLIFRYPIDFNILEFIAPITQNIPKGNGNGGAPKSISTQNTIFNVRSKITGLYFDYCTVNIPSRVFLEIPQMELSTHFTVPQITFSSNLDGKICLYITNQRKSYNYHQFGSNSLPYSEMCLAPIVSIVFSKYKVDYSHHKLKSSSGSLVIEGGFCFDSLKLLLSLVGHIQYGLDLPENIRPKTRKFDIPNQLMEMENQISQTLKQSLRIDEISIEKGMSRPKSVPVFESFEELSNSHSQSILESSVFDFASLSEPVFHSFDDLSVASESLEIRNVFVSIKLFAGRDLDSLYDLSPLASLPIIDSKDIECDDFEIINLRDESKFIEIRASIDAKLDIFEDPLLPMKVMLNIPDFSILDFIPMSQSKIIFGIDESKPILLQIDLHSATTNRTEISVYGKLPSMASFITQEQINFFIEFASIEMPVFPADLVVDEPLAFQVFELQSTKMRVYAHFRYWLDVHIDDVILDIPSCRVYACKGGDGLVGSLAEFYISAMSRPGAAAFVSGLPVIKNIRRITSAFHDLFTFDTKKYGFAIGLGRSFSALLQVVAMETLNAGANASTIAERFLEIALSTLNGSQEKQNPMATLVVNSSSKIPSILITPGIMSFSLIKKMLKSMRDKIDPQYLKVSKYKK